MRDPIAFIDEHGMIDKLYGRDGGDTCQREGMFWTLLGMMSRERRNKWLKALGRTYKDYEVVMGKLHVADGVFVRHHKEVSPDVNAWDRMSRDQFQAMIQAAGYWSATHLYKIRYGHFLRGFIFTNNVRRNGSHPGNHDTEEGGKLRNYDWKLPDFTGPDIWGAFIRGFNNKWYWPLLFIFDLEMLGSAIKWRFFADSTLTMNHTLIVLVAKDRMPTFWSWLAVKIISIEKLIELLEDHFDDFDDGDDKADDLYFMGEMFRDALASVNERKEG